MPPRSPRQLSFPWAQPPATGVTIGVARRGKGLSMFALARLAGVDRATVQRIEKGKQSPTARTARRLERALAQDALELRLARAGVKRGSRAHLRDMVPWLDDPVARFAVAAHPEGLSVDRVADIMGLSPRNVDASQASAFAKLGEMAKRNTPEGVAVRLWIERITEARAVADERESARDWMGESDDDE